MEASLQRAPHGDVGYSGSALNVYRFKKIEDPEPAPAIKRLIGKMPSIAAMSYRHLGISILPTTTSPPL
jgi:hypothetical protein